MNSLLYNARKTFHMSITRGVTGEKAVSLVRSMPIMKEPINELEFNGKYERKML